MSSEGSQQLLKRALNKDQMIVYKMDVTRDEDIDEVYNKVVEDFEENGYYLWSVVNNAGYGILGQLEWVDLDQMKNQFEVNVFGTVRVTKKFLQLVKQAKGYKRILGY